MSCCCCTGPNLGLQELSVAFQADELPHQLNTLQTTTSQSKRVLLLTDFHLVKTIKQAGILNAVSEKALPNTVVILVVPVLPATLFRQADGIAGTHVLVHRTWYVDETSWKRLHLTVMQSGESLRAVGVCAARQQCKCHCTDSRAVGQ